VLLCSEVECQGWNDEYFVSSVSTASNEDGVKETWLAPIMEHPLDVGIVFDGNYDSRYRSDSCNTTGTRSVNCGHRLRLSKLMNYMGQSASVSGSGSAATTSLLCPICQTPIVWVVDGIAVAALKNDSHTDASPETTYDLFQIRQTVLPVVPGYTSLVPHRTIVPKPHCHGVEHP
jgi:hypothetical protein